MSTNALRILVLTELNVSMASTVTRVYVRQDFQETGVKTVS